MWYLTDEAFYSPGIVLDADLFTPTPEEKLIYTYLLLCDAAGTVVMVPHSSTEMLLLDDMNGQLQQQDRFENPMNAEPLRILREFVKEAALSVANSQTTLTEPTESIDEGHSLKSLRKKEKRDRKKKEKQQNMELDSNSGEEEINAAADINPPNNDMLEVEQSTPNNSTSRRSHHDALLATFDGNTDEDSFPPQLPGTQTMLLNQALNDSDESTSCVLQRSSRGNRSFLLDQRNDYHKHMADLAASEFSSNLMAVRCGDYLNKLEEDINRIDTLCVYLWDVANRSAVPNVRNLIAETVQHLSSTEVRERLVKSIPITDIKPEEKPEKKRGGGYFTFKDVLLTPAVRLVNVQEVVMRHDEWENVQDYQIKLRERQKRRVDGVVLGKAGLRRKVEVMKEWLTTRDATPAESTPNFRNFGALSNLFNPDVHKLERKAERKLDHTTKAAKKSIKLLSQKLDSSKSHTTFAFATFTMGNLLEDVTRADTAAPDMDATHTITPMHVDFDLQETFQKIQNGPQVNAFRSDRYGGSENMPTASVMHHAGGRGGFSSGVQPSASESSVDYRPTVKDDTPASTYRGPSVRAQLKGFVRKEICGEDAQRRYPSLLRKTPEDIETVVHCIVGRLEERVARERNTQLLTKNNQYSKLGKEEAIAVQRAIRKYLKPKYGGREVSPRVGERRSRSVD